MPKNLKTETIALFILILAGLVMLSTIVARNAKITELEETAAERLQLYRRTISYALEKYSYLPSLISRNSMVVSMMQKENDLNNGHVRPSDTTKNKTLQTVNIQPFHKEISVNRFLTAVARKSGAAAIYVMGQYGNTVASSNWDTEESYVGQNYGFRPYFTDALAGKEGSFYAIGASTDKPGYFLSHPIQHGGKVIGVVVVKVNLAELQQDWLDGGETVFVTDSNGVIFLSSKQAWKYMATVPLTPDTLKHIRAGHQYHTAELQMLPMEKGITGGAEWISISHDKYLWSSTFLPALKWRLHFLSPWRTIDIRVNAVFFITLTLSILLVVSQMFLRERRLKEISQRKVRDAEKIRKINAKLQLEIEERCRTEEELRQAQNELIQAGKLAVIGQMATGIVHELNQPIAATRMSIASCKLMMKRNKLDTLENNLQWILELNDRMSAITKQLKNFSRKSPLKMAAIDPLNSIEKAVELLKYTISDAECTIVLPMENDFHKESQLLVSGDALRLEQVFVNIIRNALDAMEDQNEKRIEVSLTSRNNRVEISITDSGPGIDEEILDRLFEPFFTTKAKGDSLGIGLSISHEIIKEMNGELRVDNRTSETGGAIFTILMQRYQDSDISKNSLGRKDE